MSKAAPDIVWGKGPLRNVCRKVFSYEADYYNLQAYEAVLPGSAERIWNIIHNEAANQGLKIQQ